MSGVEAVMTVSRIAWKNSISVPYPAALAGSAVGGRTRRMR